MALDPKTWLPQAKALEIGQRQRTEHDCGSGKTLLVQHKATGWTGWCHRCNDDGWVPHPAESLSAKIARLTAARVIEDTARENPVPPRPANLDPRTWPLEARVWLYKAGMSNDAIQAAGFYYHERMQRVVLPVLSDDGLPVYWQARGFDPERPKYINPAVDKSALVYKVRPPDLPEDRDLCDNVRGNLPATGEVLVFTEDILSAWKVGREVETWCLLGTNFPAALFAEVLRRRPTVWAWLDPDQAGQKGITKIIKKLRGYGIDVRRLQSDQDPKLLSGHDIRVTLGLHER